MGKFDKQIQPSTPELQESTAVLDQPVVRTPEQISTISPGEWSKRITLDCINGRWFCVMESKPGHPIVTMRDVMFASRTIRVKQREEARKSYLKDRLAAKSKAAGKVE